MTVVVGVVRYPMRASSLRAVSRFGTQPVSVLSTLRGWQRNRSCRCLLAASARAFSTGSLEDNLDKYKMCFQFAHASPMDAFKEGNKVTINGFLQQRKDMSSKLAFSSLSVPTGPECSITSRWEEKDSPEHLAHQEFKSIPHWSPVSVSGTVVRTWSAGNVPGVKGDPSPVAKIELRLESIQALNPFPKDIIVSKGVQFPPNKRYLQIRFSEALRRRLDFRDYASTKLRETLREKDFTEVETPILFKSTPEGAREFLVPTRRRGMAYALPQSPQQYKQVLMAAGIGRYYQFARCFRDEDLRADRQPEFTQLDLEMSFATGKDVMETVEHLIRQLYSSISEQFVFSHTIDEDFVPVPRPSPTAEKDNDFSFESEEFPPLTSEIFPRMTYDEVMSRFGSDKPDLRIPGEIRRIDSIIPSDFIGKITKLKDPVIEAFRLPLTGTPRQSGDFVKKVWDALTAALAENPEGMPAVMIYDSSRPLQGLFALGHEALDKLTSNSPGLEHFSDFEDGDLLVVQARKNAPFQGGSTALGSLRTLLYQEAVSKGLLPHDHRNMFLWVAGFPLFSPNSEVDVGQGGAAGFSSTHHPFTAPLTAADLELLATDPMRARADHYDLVLNGVELGGGSRRIHVAQVQEYVMREVLRMSDAGVAQFAHLLDALRAGCPPHAGFAFGFDRLVAVLSGTGSVRDVIAFPKNMKGEEMFAKSPSRLTPAQLETYHLQLRPRATEAT